MLVVQIAEDNQVAQRNWSGWLPFHEDYLEELASKQNKIPRRLLDLMYVYSVDH